MTARPETVVVGIDGSPNARAALRFALAEARRRDARIEALMAWHLPFHGALPEMPLPIDNEEMERSYRAELDSILDAEDLTGVTVERTVIEGPAAHRLLDAAKDAALLVVGSRGRGGFVGLLLGSVSHQVASHAPCPVVIVPPDDED